MTPLGRTVTGWCIAWLLGEILIGAGAFLGRSPWDSVGDGVARAEHATLFWTAFSIFGLVASSAWIR